MGEYILLDCLKSKEIKNCQTSQTHRRVPVPEKKKKKKKSTAYSKLQHCKKVHAVILGTFPSREYLWKELRKAKRHELHMNRDVF